MHPDTHNPEPAPLMNAGAEPFTDDARLRSGRIFLNVLLIPGVIFIHAATREMERMDRAADLWAYSTRSSATSVLQ